MNTGNRRPSPLRAIALSIALAAAASCRPAPAEPRPPHIATGALPAPSKPVPSDGLTPLQRRGKQIYLLGTTEVGRIIEARLGGSRSAVSAALVSCGNCHGHDGRGRPEGGIDPPDIRYATLLRPRPPSGRKGRAAYTPALVGRALAMGLDASGEQFGDGMPRYQLTPEDLSELLAYLEVLGAESEPGVTSESLTIGTLIPPDWAARGVGDCIKNTLAGYADDFNRRGGAFNRKLKVEVQELPASPSDTQAVVAAFLKRTPVFALVGAYTAGHDGEVAGALRAAGVTLIGPFARLRPSDSDAPSVFHVHSGIDGQALALAACALQQPGRSAPAVVLGEEAESKLAADAISDVWVHKAATSPERIVIGAQTEIRSVVVRLSNRGPDVVFFLGPPSALKPLADAAAAASWRPRLYLPAAVAGDILGLPTAFDGRVFVALPYMPDDVTPSGVQRYERMHARASLPREHRAIQMAVLAAAEVLEEGLRRCGRELSRARLVEELERLDGFPTGFSRPLTFKPTRHVGAWGAYILRADLAVQRLTPLGWTEAGGPTW